MSPLKKSKHLNSCLFFPYCVPMQETREHRKPFSSKQTTDLAHLPKSRQTQKDIISTEENKL